MSTIHYQYQIDGTDFQRAGEASSNLKQKLKQMNLPADIIRRCSIAIYEGEINMVIHANGGVIDVFVTPDQVQMLLKDVGPGIPDIDRAMQEGFSTANDEVNMLGFGAGMGLPNMKRASDEFYLESELGIGTTVKMSIHF